MVVIVLSCSSVDVNIVVIIEDGVCSADVVNKAKTSEIQIVVLNVQFPVHLIILDRNLNPGPRVIHNTDALSLAR